MFQGIKKLFGGKKEEGQILAWCAVLRIRILPRRYWEKA